MFDGLSCGAGWNLGSSECAVFLFGIEQGSGSIAVHGGWNVEIGPLSDFQGRWEESGNLVLVFLAFYRPSFPRPTSGPSTLTRPSLANFDRRFYPRQTAKNLKASSLFGVGSEKALSRRGFRVDEGSMDCGAGLFGVERVVAESSARRWKCGNRA